MHKHDVYIITGFCIHEMYMYSFIHIRVTNDEVDVKIIVCVGYHILLRGYTL